MYTTDLQQFSHCTAPPAVVFLARLPPPPPTQDFGAGLASAMRALPLEDALAEDAEISLRRVRPLPPPEELLGDGSDGTADDPRIRAAWQLAAISELARRHGWELLECADAVQEERDRAAAGVSESETRVQGSGFGGWEGGRGGGAACVGSCRVCWWWALDVGS